MERVSSVTAFVLRYFEPREIDPEARAVVEEFSAIERRVLELLARVPRCEERRHRLAEETGEAWDTPRYERVEARALLRLQHELQQRKLLES
jgi:hypothetical protein